MRKKPYYSIRTGMNPMSGSIDLPIFIKLFSTLYCQLVDKGFFQEDLSFNRLDAGSIPGTLGHDIEGVPLLELHKTNLTPIRRQIDQNSEDDLFDIIEFLYHHCSKPVLPRIKEKSVEFW